MTNDKYEMVYIIYTKLGFLLDRGVTTRQTRIRISHMSPNEIRYSCDRTHTHSLFIYHVMS